jgi:DNA-binding NarL/FixJ family response regulator
VSYRILLADDHLVVREGLKALLEREGFRIVGEASDGLEAVARARELVPDVVVLDLTMPNLNGIGAAQEIVHSNSRIKAVLLTMHTEDRYILDALRAGIQGYVLKSRAVAELVAAIREVSRGLVYLSPGISRAVVEGYLNKNETPPQKLTPRERQVLQLIAEGRSTKEVASLLNISFKTAESHRTRIMAKLEIHATAGLVRYAIRLGIIEP